MKIVIWTGPAWETWGPGSLKTGLGGSEIAAIHMSAELARWGHEVAIIGQVTPCEWEGVKFCDHRLFGPGTIGCDVFISSRMLDALQRLKPDAKLTALWCHDIHVGDDWQGRMRQYDLVLCLSQWAKKVLSNYYNDVPKDKFILTRNGIDPRLFLREPKKAGCRAIYSSSPDRGLDHLLNYWPRIRAIRPDAELHVYYGFETWQAMATQRKNAYAQSQIDFFKTKLAQLSDQGVVSHGRVGQVELAKAYLGASLWLYPTNFLETSCCHPDTLISLPGDHRLSQPYRVRIADLAGKTNFPVYAYDSVKDCFCIGTALWCKQTKIAEEMVEITLDDGSSLKLTPEQLVMGFNDQWTEAGSLQPGDRLLALHHRYAVMIKDTSGKWIEESRLVGEWLANQQGFSLTRKLHVDHLDPLRLDNFPEHLQILSDSEHFKKTHKGKFQRHAATLKKAAASRKWIADNLETVTAKLKQNGKKLWNDVNALSPEDRAAWCKERSRKKQIKMRLRSLFPDFEERVRNLAVRHAQKNQLLGHGFWDWMAILPPELQRSIIEDTVEGKWNHRVISVRRIPGGPVFDMEVSKHHNFIAGGIVIHNCISAMEAQAAGTLPIATKLAALAETVRHGILVAPPNSESRYEQEFLGHVRDFLEGRQAAITDQVIAAGREWALRSLSWTAVAGQWEELFEERLKKK